MNITELGYLENSYLDAYGYLSGQIQAGLGMQVRMKLNAEDPIGLQSEMMVFAEDPIGLQSEMFIKTTDTIGMQSFQRIVDDEDDPHIGSQVDMIFQDQYGYVGMESEMRVIKEDPIGMQALMEYLDKEKHQGMQVLMRWIDYQPSIGMQTKIFPLAHWLCPSYLNTHPYLSSSYLAECMRAFQGMQVEGRIFETPHIGQQASLHIIDTEDDIYLGSQVEMRIFTDDPIGHQVRMHIIDETDDPHIGTQVRMMIVNHLLETSQQVLMRIVDHRNPIGMQTNMLKAQLQGVQSTMVIYNITQLRILCSFISRGTPALAGNNWSSMWPLEAGDFLANNVNTDIIEQRTQTDGLPALWELRCDTGIPQGGFVDTVAILDHNFTRSARITFQGTNDPTWGVVGQSIVLVTESTNMYYISPTLPTQSWRYFRFLIEDYTNPDNYLRIGVIVFGSSNLFTLRECFQNPVTFGTKHFKDTIETEGYTNVSNDRAMRKFLTLNFDNLKYDGGNFGMLRNYFNTAKTDIKCLIIPRPTRPSSLAVFSKLIQLPEESHIATADDNHHVTLTLSWDESL